MITIINWTMRRAGAGMTISGVEQATGRPIKLTGVGEASSAKPHPVATGKDGERYQLA